MDMPQIHPTYERAPGKVSDAQSSFPRGNRQTLTRIFQAIDGCSKGEAEIQIDALVTEFQGSAEPRHPLLLHR